MPDHRQGNTWDRKLSVFMYDPSSIAKLLSDDINTNNGFAFTGTVSEDVGWHSVPTTRMGSSEPVTIILVSGDDQKKVYKYRFDLDGVRGRGLVKIYLNDGLQTDISWKPKAGVDPRRNDEVMDTILQHLNDEMSYGGGSSGVDDTPRRGSSSRRRPLDDEDAGYYDDDED